MTFTIATTAAERRVLHAIATAIFHEEEGCRHGQQMIALRAGCSREHANRCIRSLERKGLLYVTKPRKRGECCTYHVRDWNPPCRNDVIDECRVLRARFRRRQAALRGEGHTKGTAGGCRAQTAVAHPPSVPETHCHYRTPEIRIAKRRSVTVPDDEGKLFHGDVVCLRCRQLEQQIEAQRAKWQQQLQIVARTLEEEGEKRAAAEHQARRSGMAELAARRELARALEDEPQAEEITTVLQHWQNKLGHPKANIKLAGKRAGVVRKSMRLGHTDPPLENVLDELLEAIDGLALFPYVGPGRKPTGTPKERYDDVEHALRDEATIERFRGYARRGRDATPEAIKTVWQRVCATEHAYYELLMAKITCSAAREASVDPRLRKAMEDVA